MAWNPLVPGSAVCVCLKVCHNEARDLVLSGKVRNFDELKAHTDVGTKCTLCVPYFEQIIDMYLKQKAAR